MKPEINKELYLSLHSKVNHFEEFKNVKSKLCFGNLDYTKNPYITYFIPTFNRVETLRQAVESILRQNNEMPFEVIVVDNSAIMDDTNPTLKYIKELANPNILFYVNEQNIGQAGNWNRGFELARGNYLVMLHDDDLLSDDYAVTIKNILSKVESDKKFGVLIAEVIRFHEAEGIPKISKKRTYRVKKEYKITSLLRGIGPCSCPTAGIVFNPKAVLDVGGFSDKFFPSMDYVLGYQLLVYGYNVYKSEDVLGFIRIAINETIKKENLLNFVKCDYYFREYLYTSCFFYKIFGLLFRDIQYSFSVDKIYMVSKNYGQDIAKEEFIFTNGYGKGVIRKFLFRLVRKIITKLTTKYF